MDFSLTDEQAMFRNLAREFAARHLEPVARENDEKEQFPWQIVKEMGPLGLLGLAVPQEYGGLGLDHICYAVVTEEIARASLSMAMSVFGTHSVVGKMIATWGTEEQRQKYLPAMCNGEIFSCCAWSERDAGINLRGINSRAELGEGWWVLEGEKVFAINGGISSLALALAKATGNKGDQGLAAFLVGSEASGFSSKDVYGKSGLRASNIANISFQGCRIPQENLLGNIDDGTKIAESLLNDIHFSVAASCVGAAQASIDASVKYAEERLAFGRPISHYDMVQEVTADMIVGTEAARLLTYQVGGLKDKGEPFAKQLSMARCLASEVALRAATNAIQVHGAYGFGKEFPVERYIRDVAEVNLYGGPFSIHKLRVARSVFGIGA